MIDKEIGPRTVNVNNKIKMLLEGNIGGYLYDLGRGQDFLNSTHTKVIPI